MKFVCLLASRRTGSNHVCSLLSKSAGLNVKYEIFHRTWSAPSSDEERECFEDASSRPFADEAEFRQWRAAHPAKALEAYYLAGQRRPLVFKLFPEHMERSLIASELFSSAEIGFLVLRRRPIESYISDRKAEIVGCYHRVDTTEVKPALSAEHFAPWAEDVRDWYAWAARELAASGAPWVDLDYETQFRVAGDDEAFGVLADALERLGLPRPKITYDHTGLPRQDREPDYKSRVANWAEFAAALRERAQTCDLLDWAETAPGGSR